MLFLQISNTVLSIWQAAEERQSLCISKVDMGDMREHVAEANGEGKDRLIIESCTAFACHHVY
jgi:hypothetical protein